MTPLGSFAGRWPCVQCLGPSPGAQGGRALGPGHGAWSHGPSAQEPGPASQHLGSRPLGPSPVTGGGCGEQGREDHRKGDALWQEQAVHWVEGAS